MKTRPQITIVEPRIRMPGLAQRLAEELQARARCRPRPTILVQKRAISPSELSQSPGYRQPACAHYLITCSSGCVASSVWVKT